MSAYFTLSSYSPRETLTVPILVSIPVGDFLEVDWVYQSYLVTFEGMRLG